MPEGRGGSKSRHKPLYGVPEGRGGSKSRHKPLYEVLEGRGGTKKAPDIIQGFNLKSATTYSPTIAVPSALAGLTSLFGMGRGGTPPL